MFLTKKNIIFNLYNKLNNNIIFYIIMKKNNLFFKI